MAPSSHTPLSSSAYPILPCSWAHILSDKEKKHHKLFVIVLVILSCVVASAGLFFAWWIWKQKGQIY